MEFEKFPFTRTHNSPNVLRWLLWGGLAVFILAGSLLFWPQKNEQVVQAKSNYLTSFVNTYPQTAGTQLDSCSTCHTSVPNRNPYGDDYKSHGHNFQAIELLDSDGDGYSNIDEINALTLPGDPNSHPGSAPTSTPAPTATPPSGTPPPAGAYQLIGWNDLGMHCMNESFANLAILPPYNNMWAQLIRTGSDPEIVTDNVVIEYSFQNNTTSSNKIDFWQYANQLFGVNLQPDEGLTGARLTGTMRADGDHFVVEGVPLTPYEDNAPHVQQPYQLADLVAKDATTGEVLARTTFVAPVSTEMHCDDCHSDGMEGIATGNTETNILSLHDKEEDTNLMAQRPVLCANCHASNALGMSGNPDLPSLSHAIHSKHGGEGDGGDDGGDCDDDGIPNSLDPNDGCDEDGAPALSMAPDGVDAASDAKAECYQCHPGPQTKCLRGTMAAAGQTCQDCHGSIQDVASENREPWVDLPTCGSCHGDQYAEEPGKLFRQSKGHGGLYCESCHGSTHAILPSTEDRDNIQVIRLQGYAGTLQECSVCHGDNAPDGPGPHGMTNPHPNPTATPTLPAPTVTPTSVAPTATPTAQPTAQPTVTPAPTATPQSGAVQLWLEPVHRVVGEDETFVLDMKSDGASVAGYEVTLRFDPAVLQAQSATLGDWLQNSGRTASPLGPTIDNRNGVIKFGAYSFGSGQPPSGESWLARFTFRAISKGESQVRLTDVKLTDATGQVYANVQTRDARITVEELEGDLNGDCIVDISDIMLVVSVWGVQNGQPGWNPALDLDANGIIDIGDIMIVVGHWGETCSSASAASGEDALPRDGRDQGRFGFDQTAQMRFSPSDGAASLPAGVYEVRLTAAQVRDLASFETTVIYDASRLQVESVKISDWLSVSGRQIIPLGPDIDNAAGRVTLGAVSFGSQPGANGSGVLATLRFRVIATGASQLNLQNAKMTDTQGAAIPLSTESGRVTIGSEAVLYLPALH